MILREDQLHNYQVTSKQHIIDNLKSALFLEMGLGKTVATLTAIRDLMFREFEIHGVLVVAPKRVASSVWHSEIKKWAHLNHMTISRIQGTAKQRRAAMAKNAHIYTLGRDNVVWYFQESVRPRTNMLVIDESTSFKNHDSKRFKEIRKHTYKFRRVVILTGSPAPNGYMGLWSQFFLLDNGKRLERTITKYRETYFYQEPYKIYTYLPFPGSKERIHEKVGDITTSMKSEDYLELPERSDNTVKIEIPEELQKKYREFERELLLELDAADITAVNAASLSIKLQQFCNGAVYDEDRNVHKIHDLKLDALDELLDSDKNVLIAWAFQHDRDRILERFKKYKPVQLSTDKDIDNWNEGKIRMLLMHPASGGHGLNLQHGGHTIVWFGPTWDLELYQQLNARLHRQGQLFAVFIHHLVIAGSIEEDIINALKNKSTGQEALMKAVKNRLATLKSTPS